MEQQPVALRRGLAPEQRPVQEAEILPSLGVLVRIVEGDLGACDLPAVQRSGKAVLSQQAFALAFPAGQDLPAVKLFSGEGPLAGQGRIRQRGADAQPGPGRRHGVAVSLHLAAEPEEIEHHVGHTQHKARHPGRTPDKQSQRRGIQNRVRRVEDLHPAAQLCKFLMGLCGCVHSRSPCSQLFLGSFMNSSRASRFSSRYLPHTSVSMKGFGPSGSSSCF